MEIDSKFEKTSSFVVSKDLMCYLAAKEWFFKYIPNRVGNSLEIFAYMHTKEVQMSENSVHT